MALLPVSAVVDELLAALQSASQVMLHEPTGAGKSTWLPLEILRRGGLPRRVVMLEPRRLALLLDVQRGLRNDLKVLIMSATLDDRRLSQLLPDAPVIRSAGRSYPVERRYQALPAQTRTEEAIAGAVQQQQLLLFLSGVGEINRVQGAARRAGRGGCHSVPAVRRAAPLEAQQRTIRPAPASRRRVVLATNIAETSLTIEGIRLVVDSGLERVAKFVVAH